MAALVKTRVNSSNLDLQRYTIYDEAEKSFKNVSREHTITTEKKVPKLGVMFVGIGGNNGSTLVAGLLANKQNLSWETKNGQVKSNFYGSFTQCATAHVGFKFEESTN